MTEVLRIAPSPPLTRTPSQSSLCHPTNHSYAYPPRPSSTASDFLDSTASTASVLSANDSSIRLPTSLPSLPTASVSAPSSPRLSASDASTSPSFASTPASSLSLQGSLCGEEAEEIQFPTYADAAGGGGGSNNSAAPAASKPAVTNTPAPSRIAYRSVATSTATRTPVRSKRPSPPQPPPINTSLPSSSSSPPSTASRRKAPTAGDDTDIRSQPSRHVDYLSHAWLEEDVSSSWRHIVGRRRQLDNWQRLENASWRSWAKARGRLRTVSPETLNWMKDHDVTWLYGPLQTRRHAPPFDVSTVIIPTSPAGLRRTRPGGPLSRNDSFALKKSCLKKRSLSEAILHRSQSNCTLVRQAVDSLVAQTPKAFAQSRPQNISGGVHGPLRLRPDSSAASAQETESSSSTTSGAQTPSEDWSGISSRCSRRHIHFSEKVEQCIAIDGDDEPEPPVPSTAISLDDSEDDLDGLVLGADAASLPRTSDSRSSRALARQVDDESDDDSFLMMKPEQGKARRLSHSGRATPTGLGSAIQTPRGSFLNADGSSALVPTVSGGSNASTSSSSSKTIAMLPSTTLKSRGDTPEPPTAAAPPSPFPWNLISSACPSAVSSSVGRLASSASQETLKPSRPSSNFLIDEDDEDDGRSGSFWRSSAAPASPSARYSSGASTSASSVSGASGGLPAGGVRIRPRDLEEDDLSDSDADFTDEETEMSVRGLRRTASGMYMPAEGSKQAVSDSALGGGYDFGDADEADDEAVHEGMLGFGLGWNSSTGSGSATRHARGHGPSGASRRRVRRAGSGVGGASGLADDGSDANAGLLGRVVETVNTAKDIAHVIWNVGWKR